MCIRDSKKPMRRLWISSMEDSAIKEGFSRLKNGEEYDALFASALCRAKADWLIGINATRLFSVLYNHTLNAVSYTHLSGGYPAGKGGRQSPHRTADHSLPCHVPGRYLQSGAAEIFKEHCL